MHTEKELEWRRKWKQTPAGKACLKRERESPAYKERMRRYYLKNRKTDKLRARIAVGNAIRYGKMPRAKTLKCHHCEKQAQHYHHHQGYSIEHWLHVIPLCATCHYVAASTKS